MNLPNFKEIIQKLSIFKNNLSLLASVILVVVAIGLFVPTHLISSGLRQQIQQESVNKGNRVKSKSVEPISAEQWKEEQKYQRAYANDANQIELWAKASTQRELLSYEIFPEPKSSSILVFERFGKRFRAGIDELMARTNARECPTDAEIEQSLKSVTIRSPLGMRRPLSSLPATKSRTLRRSYKMLGEIEKKIVDGVCTGRAKVTQVYGNPIELSGYELWAQYKYDVGVIQAVKDCWYWQLGYWVIEDVIATIEKMNSGSDSVFTSPVKRLRGISFGTGQRVASYVRASAGTKRKSEVDKPSYVRSIKESLTVPYTGRYCDDDIDVIHFNVVVVVSAESVFSFMRELCSAKEHKFLGFSGQEPEQTFKHNQITILESSINPVDRESIAHELYCYGEDAVVELDLICEYIFIKSGYEDIQPDSVKEDLKIEEETTGRRRRG